MKLDTALDEFGLLQRRRHRGEEGRRVTLALAALREYLATDAGAEDTEALKPADLIDFLLEHYPSEEQPDPEVALVLLEVCAEFALWLLERSERSLAPFAAAAERLREDLPRVMEALALLREDTRRDDLATTLSLSAEESEEQVAEMTGGLDRLVRLDEVRYHEAQMDYYTVFSLGDDTLALQSSEREALGEGVAEAVKVPARVTGLLRVGDIVHAEIAPGTGGWELLEVFGIRPGGYL
jgi:hypothetical protein